MAVALRRPHDCGMGAADPAQPPEDGRQATDLVARLPAIVWEADGFDLRMTFVSARARDLLGHDPDAWCATPGFWRDHLHPDDRERVLAAVDRTARAGGGTFRARYRFRLVGGEHRWIQDSISVVARADGGIRVSGLMIDVTDDQGELEAIAAGTTVAAAVASRQGAMHESIVDNLNDGVYYVDTERRISYWNKGAERLTGFRSEEVVGRHCYDNILCHVDGTGANLCVRGCPLLATMEDGTSRNVVVWLRHADGSRRPVATRTAPIRTPDERIIGGVEIFNDATGLIEAQDAAEAARRDALTDQLTGLPNRRLLDVVLAARRDDLDRSGHGYGFLIADVDNFKVFNDRYGHDVGDVALRVVASTLRGGVRGGDALVRWGGEEFAIVAAVSDDEGMTRLASRLLSLMRSAHVRADGQRLPVRVSIGGAIARPGEAFDQLFVRADQALLRAKATGRDRFVLDGMVVTERALARDPDPALDPALDPAPSPAHEERTAS
jgi:diguanylate cyclase (GGDEF)-like protein/PAS domain S-box-containing protein